MNEFTITLNNLKKCGIDKILALENVTEIAVNEPETIWFERGNGWESLAEHNCTYLNLDFLATSLATSCDTGEISRSNPIHSVTLPYGERGQLLVPPAVKEGSISLTIRKPSTKRFSLDSYVTSGRLDDAAVFTEIERSSSGLTKEQKYMSQLLESRDFTTFFKESVNFKLNHVTVGATGSGKTTFMKAIADLYDASKRIITIEDTHELDLPNHPNKVHTFFKRDGVGVTATELIESAMRMKPDHIFLTELRGQESWSYLSALNTGHSGSVTSIHANSNPLSVYARLATLIKDSKTGSLLDYELIMNTIVSTIDIISFWDKSHLKNIYFNPHAKNKAMQKLISSY